MTTQLLVALVGVAAAIVSAASAIAGIVVGRRLDVKYSRMRDLGERRARGYQDLASEYFTLRESMRRVAICSVESNEATERIEATRDAGIAWNRAVVGVWINGTPETAALARQLDHQMNELFTLTRSREFTIDEWYDLRESSQTLMDSYLSSVRDEFELPALRNRLTDYGRPPTH